MQKILAPLLRKSFLTPDTVQLDFAWPEAPLSYEAGQFFMVEFTDALGRVSRAYSVSSEPDLAEGFSLCVKLVEKGRASEYFRQLKVGEAASFMLPFGHFIAPKTDDRELLMIATGTGLAPL
jgi:ferredoxin-NADP reductase